MGMSKFIWEERQSELAAEFERYLWEHPEFAAEIPAGAHVVLLLEGDEEFNEEARRVAQHNAEEGHPIVYVIIKRLGPPRSRIEELELTVS